LENVTGEYTEIFTTPMTTTVVVGNPQVPTTPTAKTPVVRKTTAKKKEATSFYNSNYRISLK
jgi:hypothetical protein